MDAIATALVYRSRSVNGRVHWGGWGREAAVLAAAALLLALLGPFDTWATPFPLRLANWCLFVAGGYLFFRPVVGAARVIGAQTRMPRLPATLLACALAAMPTTLLVAWATGGMQWDRQPLAGWVQLYPEVVLIGVLVTAMQRGFSALEAAPPPDAEASPTTVAAVPATDAPATGAAPATPFLDRLPPALGRDLRALENEDHYVRAHTALGSTLLLMRMRDAVAELALVDGARVHRSWWVARGAVADVLRRDRAVVLRLHNGLEVPVARAGVPELRAAGWL